MVRSEQMDSVAIRRKLCSFCSIVGLLRKLCPPLLQALLSLRRSVFIFAADRLLARCNLHHGVVWAFWASFNPVPMVKFVWKLQS